MATLKTINNIEVIKEKLDSYGQFPNNDFALLVYKDVFDGKFSASDFEKLFEKNEWKNSWRNGIYPYHHYHSTTHEVLGIYSGEVKVQLGGPKGITIEGKSGDVIIIPAGVAHKNLGSSDDFACVGAYPGGASYDMNYGKESERPHTDKNIAKADLPLYDPVFGNQGPLMEIWKERKSSFI